MIYLLCAVGEDHGTWEVLSAHSEREPLEVEARKLELAEDERLMAKWVAEGKPLHYRPLALDDPVRNGYRRFYVDAVPSWPDANEAYEIP